MYTSDKNNAALIIHLYIITCMREHISSTFKQAIILKSVYLTNIHLYDFNNSFFNFFLKVNIDFDILTLFENLFQILGPAILMDN